MLLCIVVRQDGVHERLLLSIRSTQSHAVDPGTGWCEDQYYIRIDHPVRHRRFRRRGYFAKPTPPNRRLWTVTPLLPIFEQFNQLPSPLPLTHQNPTMAASIILPSARQRALRLMGSIGSHSSTCPCHSNPSHVHLNPRLQTLPLTRRKYATPVDSSKEYAFEMAVSSIRFGEGFTLEVGMDVQNMGIKKVLVLTDKTVGKLLPMKNTIQSLEQHGVTYEIFDNCRVEPKDYSYCPSWGIVILIG
jgi:hypothetical protein